MDWTDSDLVFNISSTVFFFVSAVCWYLVSRVDIRDGWDVDNSDAYKTIASRNKWGALSAAVGCVLQVVAVVF